MRDFINARPSIPFMSANRFARPALLLVLAGTLLSSTHAWAQGPFCVEPSPVATPKPKASGPTADPCDKLHHSGSPCLPGTGAYFTGGTDLSIPTVGFPIAASRSYESARTLDGPMGIGWKLSLFSRLVYATYALTPTTVTKEADVLMPSGTLYRFKENADGFTYLPPSGSYHLLLKNPDGTWDLTLENSRSVYHFSDTGALLSMADDYGNTLAFTYDANGRLTKVADQAGSGRYVDLYYGASGRVSALVDSAARQVTYTYTAQGNLATVTDPENRTTTYTYTAGRYVPLLSETKDPWNRVLTTVTYDTKDRMASYTEQGETHSFAYDYQGDKSKVSKTDTKGRQTILTVGTADGAITRRETVGFGAAQSEFYADGSLLSSTDEVGVKTSYTYTSNRRVASMIKEIPGTPSPTRVQHVVYTYDATFPEKVSTVKNLDPVTGLYDPNWQAWEYEYHPIGSPAPGALWKVKRILNDGTTKQTISTTTYNSKGQILTQASASGAVTTYAYDAQTNLQSVTAPANNDANTLPATNYTYDAVGRTLTMTDPLGKTTSYTYDKLGRVLTVTLPKPSAGSPLSFVTTYAYDQADASYPSLRFTNVADPNGKITKMGYDAFGRLQRTVDAQSGVTVYGFTKDLFASITDVNGNVTSYQYDALGRLTSTTFPDGAQETYSYTADGLLYWREDRKGQRTWYAYDGLKRPFVRSFGIGSATPTSSITLTFTGEKLTQVVDTTTTPSETHTLAYDSAYRLLSETQGPRGTVSYQYTADDRVDTMAVAGGPFTTYTYYPDGSLKTMNWSRTSGLFTYTYNLSGQYQEITFPSGQKRTYAYDDQGRLTSLANTHPTTGNLATYGYGYDIDPFTSQPTLLGQRTSMTQSVPSLGLSNAATNYGYDALYQLTRADYPAATPFNGESHTWTYDAIGNRLTNAVNGTGPAYTYFKNGQNTLNGQRLQSDGVNAYTYDANGNNVTRNGAPGSFTFGYDTQNRLASISGATAASYTYDNKGRRASKTVGGTTTTYLYDGPHLIGETANAATADYLFGPGVDEPLAMYNASGLAFFAVDALGSVAGAHSPAGVSLLATTLDAWGLTKDEAGSRLHAFTYTGREVGEAGLLFYRARYYLPNVGRFQQEDPAGEGSSDYAYVANNSVSFIDPNGERRRKRPTPTPTPTPTPSPSPVVPHFSIIKRPPTLLPINGDLCDRGYTPMFWAETNFNPYMEPAKWSGYQVEFADQCRAARGSAAPDMTRAWCAPSFGWAVGAKPFGWCVCCKCVPTPTPRLK